MSETEQITEVFSKIADLAAVLGISRINKLYACWEVQVDEAWWLALNGHREAMNCSKGTSVPPFTCYVEFNGWPAGLIHPGGGTLAAGRIANENTLIAALEKRIRKAKP